MPLLPRCAQIVADAASILTVVDATTKLVVPTLGDWCIFYARSARSGVSRVMSTHPIGRCTLEGLASLDSPAVQTRLGVIGAALSRVPLKTRDCVFGAESSLVHNAGNLGCIELLIPVEVASIPVIHRQTVFGVLTLARNDGSLPYDADDMALASRICDVVGLRFSQAAQSELPVEFQ